MAPRLADDERLRRLLRLALDEDVGSGDITTRLTIPRGTSARGRVVAREPMTVCGMALFGDSQNARHAHEYVDSWASKEAAEFLLAYYYYGHTNTEADLSVVPDGVREALGLDDPTVLDEPNAHPETRIPRRSVYQQYWSEVQAA